MNKASYQYFKLRLNITATSFLALICAICIYSRDSTSPILLGLLLTYSMGIQNALTILLNIQAEIEKLMVNAQRCMIMTQVEQERESDEMLKDRPEWPENGKIEFQKVDLKYRPTTEIVLNQLSF